MVNKIKKSNAITLISLIITIVIMLILAGVSISFIIGQNGIFIKAQATAKLQLEAEVKENVEHAIAAVEMQDVEDNVDTSLEIINNKISNEDSNIELNSFDNDKIVGIYNLNGKDKQFNITLVDGKYVVSFEEVTENEDPIEVNETFAYTGDVQEFVVPQTGKYKIELWGASGGVIQDPSIKAGYGAYTSGEITLSKGTKLYIYVGQNGQDQSRTVRFNGGGYGGTYNYTFDTGNFNGYAGGGATDIRIVNGGAWDNFDGLKSRIMVAAGGGAGTSGTIALGHNVYYEAGGLGFAGGLTGYNGGAYKLFVEPQVYGYGASQISGGTAGKNYYTSGARYSNATGVAYSGSFGKGGNADNYASENGAGGGGGGYYGGGAAGAAGSGCSGCGGGGGSSFISGHAGCNAVSKSSTEGSIVASGTPNFYDSKYVFTNTKMIDGSGYEWTTSKQDQVQMPSTDGVSNYETGTGHNGDGFARITKIN